MSRINENIINCAVYEDSTEYYGMAEATLPEVVQLVEEIKGAGIAGAYESVITGHLEAMTLGLNFRTPSKEMYALNEPRKHQIDLRVAVQASDTVSGTIETEAVKHVIVCKPKKMAAGKVAPASGAESSLEMTVTYWATYIDGEQVQEIDVLNFIFKINGTDYLADVRKALGK